MPEVIEPDLFGEILPQPPARTAPAASAVPARPAAPVQLEAFPVGADQFPGQGTFLDATGTEARLDVVLLAPPPPVPCIDCGRPLNNPRSRKRGRGRQCHEERVAAAKHRDQAAELDLDGTLDANPDAAWQDAEPRGTIVNGRRITEPIEVASPAAVYL